MGLDWRNEDLHHEHKCDREPDDQPSVVDAGRLCEHILGGLGAVVESKTELSPGRLVKVTEASTDFPFFQLSSCPDVFHQDQEQQDGACCDEQHNYINIPVSTLLFSRSAEWRKRLTAEVEEDIEEQV